MNIQNRFITIDKSLFYTEIIPLNHCLVIKTETTALVVKILHVIKRQSHAMVISLIYLFVIFSF